jgi:phosphatidylinositol alpha 1,6-mannosyltransferase
LAVDSIAQVDLPVISKKQALATLYKFQPDVIHLASPFILGERIRKVGQKLGIPVVANYQTDVSGFVKYYKLKTAEKMVVKRLRKIHAKSTITLAPSTASINWLSSIGVTNVLRWGRGVDHTRFNPQWRSVELRGEWAVNDKTCVVGFVGRLAPEKQVEKLALLKDLENLADREIKFVIVGDGPSRKLLAKQLPQAIFTGHLGGVDLSRTMASFDVLVTTGENETFCQVIQEAMAAGVPVVAPEIGGPVDLIKSGETGFLYKPGGNKSIRQAVLKVIKNETERRAMGERALATVENCSWSSVCSELIPIYKRAIAVNAHGQKQE